MSGQSTFFDNYSIDVEMLRFEKVESEFLKTENQKAEPKFLKFFQNKKQKSIQLNSPAVPASMSNKCAANPPVIEDANLDTNSGENACTENNNSLYNIDLHGRISSAPDVIKKELEIEVSNSCIEIEARKYVKTLISKAYKLVKMPRLWLELLEKYKLDNDSVVETFSLVYSMISANGFVSTPIHKDTFDTITHYYVKVIKILESEGGLTVNHNYAYHSNYAKRKNYGTAKSFSKTYHVYKNEDIDFVNVEIGTKDILKSNQVIINRVLSNYSIMQSQMFNDIKIDLKSALEFMQPRRSMGYFDKQELIKVLNISKRNFYCYPSISNVNGRIYHNFNNLSKVYRKFITTKNNTKFKTIDIVAAQPSIIIGILQDKNDDCARIAEICKTNRIYDYVAEKIKNKPDKVKKDFMFLLFGNARTKTKTFLKTNFPGFIEELNNKISSFDSKSDFAHFMARHETVIMKEVFEKCPGIKITIHDEIMVEEQFYEESKIIFGSVIQKHKLPSRTK